MSLQSVIGCELDTNLRAGVQLRTHGPFRSHVPFVGLAITGVASKRTARSKEFITGIISNPELVSNQRNQVFLSLIGGIQVEIMFHPVQRRRMAAHTGIQKVIPNVL